MPASGPRPAASESQPNFAIEMSYVECVDFSTPPLSEAVGPTGSQSPSTPHRSPLPVSPSLTRNAGEQQPQQQKRKRRKIPVACDQCRERKTRCDGSRPICGPCERKKRSSCVYQEDTLRITGGTSKLERRIRALEGRSSKNHAGRRGSKPASENDLQNGPPVPSQQLDQVNLPRTVQESIPAPDSVSGVSLGGGSVFSNRPSVHRIADSERRWSAMSERRIARNVDAMVAIPFSGDGRDGFYGNSSSVAFLDTVKKSAEGLRGEPQQPRMSFPSSNLCRPQRRDSEEIRYIDATDLDLPQRRVADSLVQSYFETVHPLYPLIHKPTFLISYERLWTAACNPADSGFGGEIEDTSFHTMLNLVFAMGCPFSTIIPQEERTSRSSKFFRRSQSALSFEILEADSLVSLQILLLTSLYLQSTSHAHRCWNTVGLAIRAAQGLGLHLDEASSAWPQNQLEREMRRRIWHICVALDRVLAMTFGRPTMTSHNWTVKFPELIDDEYLVDMDVHTSDVENGHQPVSIQPRIGCFVYTLELFGIMDDILSTFYASPEGGTPQSKAKDYRSANIDFSNMVELDRRLNEFEATLPSWLRPLEYKAALGPSGNECYALQVNVLHARVLHTRLLLLRPGLLAYIQKSTLTRQTPDASYQTGLDQQFYIHAAGRCVATSHEMIAHLHENINIPAQPAPWYVVYFTLTAATVLIAAKSCPSLCADGTATTFETSWERCTIILRHLEDLSQSAVQGIAVLESLYQRVHKSLQPNQPYDSLVPSDSQNDSRNDIFDNQLMAPLEAPLNSQANAYWLTDDSILRNPLTGEDWLRNSGLNLDWLDLES